MLMLIFYVENDCYCCSCDSVLEVVPRIPFRRSILEPCFFTGIMNYGGEAVPLVDFSMLLTNRQSRECMHTRIILLSNPTSGPIKTLGIIAEKIVETTLINPLHFIEIGIKEKRFPFLDGIYNTQQKNIQRVDIDQLFTFLQNA